MEFGVLGPLEIRDAGRAIPLSAAKRRALLAVLLCHANTPVPTVTLMDALWKERPPASARDYLRACVAHLRRVLGDPGRILSSRAGYALVVHPVEIDADRFEDLAAQGSAALAAGEAEKASGLLAQALQLWRGPAFAGLDGVPGLSAEAARLEECRLTALETRVEADLALRRHTKLVGELQRLVAEHPLRERFRAQLMLALYRSDRQAEALEVYRDARRALAAELGLQPGPRLSRLEEAIAGNDPGLAAPQPPWRGMRPHLTSLTGREDERAELTALLNRHRLLSVTGAGGVGKTALALDVAAQVAPAFPDGVIAVPLLGLRDGDQAVQLLGSLVGLTGGSATEVLTEVARKLAGRRLLLVLDNCEHLAQACRTLVSRLLSAGPGLRVLVTSRAPLGAPGEAVWRLDGLRTTADGPAGGSVDTAVPAVALFVRRGREACGGFAPAGPELPAVARICRRVDGVPLALELAAARLRELPVGELADRLDQGLGLLSQGRSGADPRHRTLSATIDWSYRLLDPEGQRLLARLSVFCGWTAEAAERVCAGPPLSSEVIAEVLESLADQSLVQPYEIDGVRRYRLLEAVREYAAGKLAEFGETGAIAGRQLDLRLAQARKVTHGVAPVDQTPAWLALGADTENLRAALEHGFAGDRQVEAVELTTLLMVFWMAHRTHLTEGQRWVARAARHLERCTPLQRCKVALCQAVLCSERDDWTGALARIRPVIVELGAHEPRLLPEAAITLVVGSELRTLNPTALTTTSWAFESFRDQARGDARLLALAARAAALTVWGRYAEAAELCARYGAWERTAGPINRTRYLAARVLVALGRADRARAMAWQDKVREHFARPGAFVHPVHLHRGEVLGQLCGGRADRARAAATAAVTDLESTFPPTTSRAYQFKIMLAEAARRSGHHRQALASLADGLAEGRAGSDYSALLPGVVAGALLADTLGDAAAARDLAGRWDRLRHRLGLPAPLGFAEPVAEMLGLDPAAPAGGRDHSYDWHEPDLIALLDRTGQWVAAHRDRLPKQTLGR